MIVLTLWQPWAQLLVMGVKKNETRGWRLPDRILLNDERIAIHAAARPMREKDITPELHEICMDEFGCAYNYSLPRGRIIGSVCFFGCIPVEDLRDGLSDVERACGDYSDGRYAWGAYGATVYAPGYTARGRQKFWNWEPPGDLIGKYPSVVGHPIKEFQMVQDKNDAG